MGVAAHYRYIDTYIVMVIYQFIGGMVSLIKRMRIKD